MRFQEKKYTAWSLPWIMQHILLVLKERRLPQFKYLRRRTSGLTDGVSISQPAPYLPDEEVLFMSYLESIGWLHTDALPATFQLDSHCDEGEKTFINSYFDHIFVVNLPNRSIRRLEMIQKLTRLGMEADVFYADWGYSEENIRDYNRYLSVPLGLEEAHILEKKRMKKMIFSPGAWGYLKTYQRLLEYAKAKGYRRILCLDDDVLFHRDFHAAFGEAVRKLPAGWKLLYLGATQHQWEPLDKEPLNKNLRQTDGSWGPFYHPHYTDGTFAIGIDCSVYDILLQEITKMNCSVDSGAMRHVCRLYPGSCFVLVPNLIVANVMESDITHSREQEVFARKMRWDMSLYEHPFRLETVSVLVPVGEDHAVTKASLTSVVNQSYPAFELIIADYTPEGLGQEFLQDLAGQGKEVKLLRCSPENGPGGALRDAFEASRGKYVAVQEPTEIALPGRIEKQLIPVCSGRTEMTLSRACCTEKRLGELDLSGTAALVRSATCQMNADQAPELDSTCYTVVSTSSIVTTRMHFGSHVHLLQNRRLDGAEFGLQLAEALSGRSFRNEDVPEPEKEAHDPVRDINYLIINDVLSVIPKPD